MTGRRVLPNRRRQECFDFVYANHCMTGAIGLFSDGSIGEVFLSVDKTTSILESLGRDGAILISLAIQHGCPVETMCGAITRGENDAPATIIGALLDELRMITKDRKPPDEHDAPVSLAPKPTDGHGGAAVQIPEVAE